MDKTDTIKKYAKELATMEYSPGENPRIFLKNEDSCFATCNGADLANLSDIEIEDITGFSSIEKDVLLASKELKALIIAKTPYIGICIDSRKAIPAVLDDMAQIVGQRVSFVNHEQRAIASALKRSAAVMVLPTKKEMESGALDDGREFGLKEGYVISSGRNLYEAYVALTVLEKSAEVLLKASVLGGAKPLGKLECALMRQVYKRKYSKKEKETKDAMEG